MKIGIDIDGVLADYVETLRTYATKGGLTISNKPPTRYNMLEDGWFPNKESFLKCHKELILDKQFETMKLIDKNAPRIIENMKSMGHTVHIVSARNTPGIDDSFIEKQTENWLKSFGFVYDELHITHNKKEVGCDIFIDDSPFNFEMLNEGSGNCFLYDQPYNRELKTLKRVKTLSEFSYKLNTF